MNRREFLRTGASLVLAGGAALTLGRPGRVFAQPNAGTDVDLVALVGGEPDAMFDRGIAELGGMGRFVKRGQSVVIKPNMSWSSPPEAGANTNPLLVSRVVEHCLNAGASRVYFLDHNLSRSSYETSGIMRAGKDAGAVFVPANSSSYYQKVRAPGAKVLKSTEIHEQILEADVFINVPVLKHHGSTAVTCAMKNLMGIVWDRWYFHRNGLQQAIADAALYRRPDLNVVDAYRVMRSGGPSGAGSVNLLNAKMQIISPDIVAADAASVAQAAQWGISGADRIRYVRMAHENRLGNMNLDRLSIRRIRV